MFESVATHKQARGLAPAPERQRAAAATDRVPYEPAHRQAGVPAVDDVLGGLLARVVDARPRRVLQRAKISSMAFYDCRVAHSHNTVSGLKGDEDYWFDDGQYHYSVHFHANDYDPRIGELTSFTGTFTRRDRVYHVNLREVGDLVWVASGSDWMDVAEAEDATYSRLACMLDVRVGDIKRRLPRKEGAYVPPSLRT